MISCHSPFSWLGGCGPRFLFDIFKDRIRFVGGAVRDSLLGCSPQDFDLTTPDEPDVVLKKLSKAGVQTVPTGLAHGTITARIHGTSYQITTLRRDLQTDGRRARVQFSTSWEEDAQRRDFTFNALSVDQDSRVFDYFHGQEDLRKGLVRFIGDPCVRIQEDYLRILRFFRFCAYYGRNAPDSKICALCQEYKDGLKKISAERTTQEFLKILEAPRPKDVLRAMSHGAFFNDILQHPGDLDWVEACLRLEEVLPLEHPWIRLMALTGCTTPPCLRLTRQQQRYLNHIQDSLKQKDPFTLLCQILYHHGPKVAQAALMIEAARRLKNNEASWEMLSLKFKEGLCKTQSWIRPCFPLNGQDALNIGLQGRFVGLALRAVEAWWVKSAFAPSRAACLRALQEQAMLHGVATTSKSHRYFHRS